MRIGDIVTCNAQGRIIYLKAITKRKWRILMITAAKDEALLVQEKDYQAMYQCVSHLIRRECLDTVFFHLVDNFNLQDYDYYVVHPNHLRIHTIKSSNKDNIKALQGMPAEYFPEQE